MPDIQGIDECGINRHQVTLNHVSSSGDSQHNGNTHSQGTLVSKSTISTDCPRRGTATEQDRSAAGIIPFHGPVHSQYVTEQARLKSFDFWPPALRQQPHELMKAGFFYTGRSDQVKCFYCDGGLESWEPEDSPWGEHMKWFEDCAFFRMRKDEEDMSKTRNTSLENEMFGNHNINITKEAHLKKQCSEITSNLDIEIENKRITNRQSHLSPTVSRNLEDLRKEVQILREERTCKICLEKEATILFLPCGHLASCVNCAPALKVSS